MSIKRILAAAAASVVAASAMAVVASAVDVADYFKDGLLYVVVDDGDKALAADAGLDVTTVYGAKAYVTVDPDVVADEAAWIGGGIGTNSTTNGWRQVEWGRQEKAITIDLENGTVTWLDTEPIFTADDAYAHVWVQDWSSQEKTVVTVNKIDLLDKDGNVITFGDAAPADENNAPADENNAPADENNAPAEPETNNAPAANNVDTGVEGVAAVLGVAAVAAGAMIVAKKRK